MLYSILQNVSNQHRDAIAIRYGYNAMPYGELVRLVEGFVEPWKSFHRQAVGVQYIHPIAHLAWITSLTHIGAQVFLLGRRTEAEQLELQKKFGVKTVFPFHDTDWESQLIEPSREVVEGGITILTSGTTGTPKAVTHTWESLLRPVRMDSSLQQTVWFLPYPTYLYAGLQVLLQALCNGSTLVIPESLLPEEVAQTLVETKVTHATGTPTFWKQLLRFAPADVLKQWKPQQITIGGEAVSDDILVGLKNRFPITRISHIYASSELGRLFSVHDGKAGFPNKWLEQSSEEGIELRIREGLLFARSKNAMQRYEGQEPPWDQEGWVATGDLVRIENNRVYFNGRESDIINVGGAKVSPIQVELFLRTIEGVIDVRVYGKDSSMVGQLVCADIVPREGVDTTVLKKNILHTAREKLEPHCIPRIIQFVENIETNEAGKIIRRG